MTPTDTAALGRLTSWLADQLPGASAVRLDGVESADLGHSAETLLLAVAWVAADGEHRKDVVVRLRPAEPGLLPPYDLARQFAVLEALEPTAVRSPRALWHEPTGDVLGREFYVMERLPGEVYEQTLPEGIESDPDRLRRMCFGIVEQLAAIHLVDLEATGLGAIADGRTFLDRQLDHWDAEIRRLQLGPLPALERLAAEVRSRRPEPCPRVTLVHGDPKPGNVAFVGSEVTAVFDWELATIGDPLADLAWLELLWGFPVGLPTAPGAPSVEEIVGRYEELTGITANHREWYRAFQGLKMAVINLSGSMMYDRGESDDPKLMMLGHAVHWMTQRTLLEFGITEELESGPVLPRPRD